MQSRSLRARVAHWFAREHPPLAPDKLPESAADPKTAFILFGGGARGAAQAGALSVLFEAGIVPDLIVGTSAGAWNGAFLALDPTPQRALQLEGLWKLTTSRQVMGTRRWSQAVNALTNRVALYDSVGMRRLAEQQLADRTFAETGIPLRIVAADLISGEAKVFCEGKLLPAILASSAIPGIFPPIASQGQLLADGGLTEWAGCLTALSEGVSRIFLLGCGGAIGAAAPLNSLRRILRRSMDVSRRSSFARTVFALRATGVEVIPVYPDLSVGHALDFNHAPQLIHLGRAAALGALRAWERGDGQTDAIEEDASAS